MTQVAEQGTSVIGKKVLRREDPALLAGESKFVADLDVPGALNIFVLRSTAANARIKAIDTTAAKESKGVVAVYVAADLESEWAGPMPCAWPVTADMKNPPHYPLAKDTVRYVGDAVAVVVAEGAEEAADAAALIEVTYEELPAVVDLEEAAKDTHLVHESLGTNTSYVWELNPNPEALERAFSSAKYVVSERYIQQRLIPAAMEPRGVLAIPSPIGGDYTLYSATQVPHILKVMAALTLGIAETKLRVIAPSVGGGFGSKLNVYAEELLCLALSRRHRRPVRWVEERSEGGQATIHGRGQVQNIELAADENGKLLGVRVSLIADMGAYLQLVTPGVPLLGAFLYHGVYHVENYGFKAVGVFTNKTPTDAYRGAGRPEATYAIERAMDALARKVGVDPAEIRRRNLIQPEQFPYNSPAGLVFDSGDYPANFKVALDRLGYSKLREEQAQRRASGSRRHLGIGISFFVEMCGLAPSRVLASLNYSAGGWESATVRVLPTSKVQVVTGTAPHGQGHETSWAMIVADKLGVPLEDIEVLHSDTAIAPHGMDTYGSRSLSVGGTAVHLATERVLDKARKLAAHQLEVSEEDLEYSSGVFSVKGVPGKVMPLAGVAFEAFTAHNLPDGMEPNLEASVSWDPPNFTFPYGTHLAVVEVDEETGKVELLRYLSIDDCGNQINPLIVEGQIHGGIVQGIAQALYEEAVYDRDGNLLNPSLADYLVPSAAEMPSFELGQTVTPSPTNPLGVKGIGEAGTIASTPAIMNAIVDALSHLGVTNIEMPASPERVWRAIQDAVAS
ncbi:carbon-monoxide dehydrogenase large subunit [Ferrithrix thermotolerans DSM 19514]|uniref:Carbon-monoxide dehydrogenase large subunit n=1 Tax=Ferrithrix thermotolerans DSM 19514 TaxID=1121881 RepID=A0A1M4VQ58_9ACTN|nr:xanthine dehydrogenase family protein molybdopterin-binding subunit [Ferrithrix thermotolerans]SHE71099.1 carbon-monoxide dehydrogenase large subunit [Ferrithrix thermotolerans DSM 19514]